MLQSTKWPRRHSLHLHLNTLICFIIWLAPRAGKMNQIARCDWLPEQARWSHLAHSGLPAVSRMKNLPESHILNLLLTKFVHAKKEHTWSITHTSARRLSMVIILDLHNSLLRFFAPSRPTKTNVLLVFISQNVCFEIFNSVTNVFFISSPGRNYSILSVNSYLQRKSVLDTYN